MKGKMLVADDEAHIRELVRFNLEKEGFTVVEAGDGIECLNKVAEDKPDLVILDIMMPGKDGLEVCRTLKGNSATYGIAIIMLTAKAEEIDTVLGLELGADDYVTKPFSPRELIARVKAVLRRNQQDPSISDELVFKSLKLKLDQYEAFLWGKKVELTPKEYELLKHFIINIGKVFSRDQLLEKIWGYEYTGDTRTVDVHIRHLRIKLADDPAVVDALETVRGTGYRIRK